MRTDGFANYDPKLISVRLDRYIENPRVICCHKLSRVIAVLSHNGSGSKIVFRKGCRKQSQPWEGGLTLSIKERKHFVFLKCISVTKLLRGRGVYRLHPSPGSAPKTRRSGSVYWLAHANF